ncbi:HEAT repeat domain-containing protein [Candidatus Chlamydia sanziniae]|uniref:Uncharacterized protein n=1 Tax=Candidatus Chlamydia sanziniae TaxID=1806891 RepID=A0A1A9HTG2_9CHLA|nr:HEAT repeat domain-containing protein [Candidatus Chlamydia sanziniae]ANH78279.1 hypothetical protein Cs308_0108 [Candidatus Chlamydia sanziniae]
MIQDFSEASQEGLRILHTKSYSYLQAKLILKAFVHQRAFDRWFISFEKCQQRYPELIHDRDVLEELGMGVLYEGIEHSSVTVRAISVLSLGLARDFRLVPLVLRSLNDDSAVVRAFALQVAAQYGTESLKQAISKIARHDDSIHVRMTAYQVAVLLQIHELLPFLNQQAINPLIDGQERREAWKASLELAPQFFDATITKNDIDQALFTCEMLRTSSSPKGNKLFLELLSIQHPEVQETILQTALTCSREISLDNKELLSAVYHLALASPFPKVRLQAAAFLHLQGVPLGHDLLVEGLLSPSLMISEVASAALCSLGIHGAPLAKEYLSSVVSRKAAANLAILLLVSRQDIEKAGNTIANYLTNPEMCWAIEHFLWDTRWNLQGNTLLLYSDMVKHEIGRKLIRLLAITRYSQVKAVTAAFLAGQQEQGWSFFSGIFWEEGDVQTSESLTTDVSFAAKLEGALATLCQKKDRNSLQRVVALYSDSRWQDKLAILEGIAFSENIDAVSFLLDCCRQETPSLRSAAAGALFALFK